MRVFAGGFRKPTRPRFRPKLGWRQWRLKNWWYSQWYDRNNGGRLETQQQTWYQLCLSLALVYKPNTRVDDSDWLISVREKMDLILGNEQRNQMIEIMDFKEGRNLGISLLRKRRNQIGDSGAGGVKWMREIMDFKWMRNLMV